MDLFTLTSFLGWCTILNISLLLFTSLMLILMRDSISKLHSKLFGVDEKQLAEFYFQYLAHYKIVIIVFNLVPYISMKLIV